MHTSGADQRPHVTVYEVDKTNTIIRTTHLVEQAASGAGEEK